MEPLGINNERKLAQRRSNDDVPVTSSMIKLAKEGEDEAESFFHNSNAFTSWEIFPIYRAWLVNLPLILGTKSLNFRDKISSFILKINLSRNKGFGNKRNPLINFFFLAYFLLSWTYP